MIKKIILSTMYVLGIITFAFAETHGFERKLEIPPLLESPEVIELRAAKSEMEFLEGVVTPTYGYNQDYLGPTIRVRRGDNVAVAVSNDLDEVTTVHWHGLHVPGDMDGGPHQIIEPGQVWRPEFVISQEAATLWYHPHPMGKTGEQAYNGLAGFFIIEDERSDSLNLPRTYGVDDIPLVIQDKRFYSDGTFAYVTGVPDIMHGVIGNVILVNGTNQPYVEVPRGPVRLRILNGSDSSLHRYRLSTGDPLVQIASDGGFLTSPLELDAVILSPGERAEVVVDFSEVVETMFLDLDIYTGGSHHALAFRPTGPQLRPFALPAKLNTITPIPEGDAEKTRVFRMETLGGGRFAINGNVMDMDRIDLRIPLGSTEIWEIRNIGMGMMMVPHSFHVHDVQFQILDINGEKPPENLSGWKDTVLVWPGEDVRIIARFLDFTGVYMYHCHFLVHEDRGMMGQFEVF